MALNFHLVSPAFDSGARIPADYTCDGSGNSPPLAWHNAPEGTRALALIVDDPDAAAKTFVHWVLFNIPSERDLLPQGVDVDQHFQDARIQPVEGVNDFGDFGWGGPCPPAGNPHRYVFRLYALDAPIDLGRGVTKDQLTDAMASHILGEADLIGVYGR